MAQPVHSLVLGPIETPAIRCKTCKVPLSNATRKNCDRCRRNRTERYNRWKRSVEARKNQIALPALETHPSSAPPSKPNVRWTKSATTSAGPRPPHLSHSGTSTYAQLSVATAAPLDYDLNERDHGHQTASSQLPRDAPGLLSSLPHRINIPEYQWSEELIDALLALPSRSNFFGQFSVIADPDVDNSKRAQMFRDQLRSKGLPISYVAAASFSVSFTEPHPFRLFSFFTWTGKHRNLSPITRVLPVGKQSASTANARFGVKAGSSSRSTTTLRTCTVCLDNASAYHFYTPHDNALW
ncbi:hypothetical protein H4582DRAFT_1946206 [Lactarius indigo]|nr:hypothetical protein H4582DRAFT_1946206 [Lactarius indigo]